MTEIETFLFTWLPVFVVLSIVVIGLLQMHLHPALDHAFPVFRDESITNKLDFSGITKDGLNRAAV